MIVCVILCASVYGQNKDTICLPRTEFIDMINREAQCDTALQLANQLLTTRSARIDVLEEVRGELIISLDLCKSNRRLSDEQLKLCEEGAKKEIAKAKLLTRLTVAIAVVVEIATIWVLVR